MAKKSTTVTKVETGRRVNVWRVKRSVSEQNIKNLNLASAILLALQAIVFFALGNVARASQMVTTNYVAKDSLAGSSAGHSIYVPATHRLFDLSLVYVVGIYLLVGAITALAAATIRRAGYEHGLALRINKYRWAAWAVISSLMLVSIGLLLGVTDISLLLALIGLTAITSVCIVAFEANRLTNRPLRLAAASKLLAGIVLAIYALGAYIYGNGLPAFVWWILGSMLILLGLKAWTVWRYRGAATAGEYLVAERAFIVLSFLAQSALAWQIFFGTGR